ncbi:MAG: hypothetical protein NT166_30835, partial [Candidatus Aminicenantes bacterium]|nr:hypothetical protein [Candidatus Aminicenantes bacterium]
RTLAIWIRKLLKVAVVAFKPNPQYLEKCGILVLSEGYKRAKAANEPSGTTPTAKSKVEMPADME